MTAASELLDSVRQHLNNSKSTVNDNECEIVISGISGRFPESSNVDEFKKNLYENIDMVTSDERRWPPGLYGLPECNGKLKNIDIDSFDNEFFNVHSKQVEYMDPQMRILLEITHEAIIDAGINPKDIRGTNTGVYVAISFSESETYWYADADLIDGYNLPGHAKSMYANRLSYTFDFKGPSYSIDTACSSSVYALANAFNDIKSGRVDSAIVAGVNLVIRPICSLQFKRFNILSANGKCKSFDASGDGYVRSDGCVTILIQKSKDAKRIYTKILNAKTNTDGYKNGGITVPNGEIQNRLIRETYAEIGLDPREISYIEAHGTGTKVGDPQEINSISDFFCKNRKDPLLIGSVKSNMGHSEPSSGLCAIAKIILAMETGELPANLHFNTSNPELTGIVEGDLKVVDKNTFWPVGLVAMNSFGFGGANGHIIFAPNSKVKRKSVSSDGKIRLAIVSGRTEEAVQLLLEDAELNRHDDEYLTLVNGVHMNSISMHPYRGYSIFTKNNLITREVSECKEKQPIWFIYSGMGAQWGQMAKDFMQFEVFRTSINRCADVLKKEGVNLLPIILENDDESFNNILYSLVGIAACQIALTDMLFSFNIHPDGLVGHSAGEVGCAYADGCFTLEEAILSSYWRGKSLMDTKLIKGKMAAVGKTWEECHKILPPDVIPVCHNSNDNVTISGPAESVTEVIEQFTSQGIFAKEVRSSGYAFHSKYIDDVGPLFREKLDTIITSTKLRSPKWISTSIPHSLWNTTMAKENSSAYHVNNLLSPVLFYEGLLHIPENAICIEIAPHGLMQAILRRVLPKSCTNISLAKRYHKNNAEFFLTNIGKLYAAGANPNITKLMPSISYPVSRGTPMLGSKIVWNHTDKWFVPYFDKNASGSSRAGTVSINLRNEDDSFLTGHTIDGRMLFPATGYLTLVWRLFAKIHNTDILRMGVIMENVTFQRATILSLEKIVKLNVSFLDGTGKFEITENGSVVVTGIIRTAENINQEELNLPPIILNESEILLSSNDIYKELRLRGYDYSGLFCGIIKSNLQTTSGLLKWDENWISYMDTMLQFSLLGNELREIYLPTSIEKIVINPIKHMKIVDEISSEEKSIPVFSYPNIAVVSSGGFEIKGMKATCTTRRPNQSVPILEKYSFVPLQNNPDHIDKIAFICSALGLIIENSEGALKIQTVELINQESDVENLLSPIFIKIIESEPLLEADVVVAGNNIDLEQLNSKIEGKDIKVVQKNISETSVSENAHFIFGSGVLSLENKLEVLKNMISSIRPNGFLLLEENYTAYKNTDIIRKLQFAIVQKHIFGSKVIILARPTAKVNERNKIVVRLTGDNFNWLDSVKSALVSAEAEAKKTYLYLVCQGKEFSGAVGLMNCIKYENGGKSVRMYFVQDTKVEDFNFNSKFYNGQLEKDLIMNIYKNGQWGTYRHSQLSSNQQFLPVEHCYINTLAKGDLSSLHWIESPISKMNSISNDHELCTVYYSALNFRDVMISSGKLSKDSLPGDLPQHDCVLGLEFAGRDSKGRRVMSLVLGKALATSCLCRKDIMWEIPENWTMEEAATIPCVYMTVYYALLVCGHIKSGEKILIHAGAGGIGIAAISVALSYGLTVFTTVGSPEKREFLKKRFPQLKDNHIGNSRNCSFEQMVLNETQGNGVDVVLNSLAEEKLQASVRCLGQNGRFLEIGKFDLSQNNPLGMSVFLKSTVFHGILVDSLIQGDAALVKRIVALVDDGIRTGVVQPLPTTVFNEKQVENAFRYLASGKHIGKVLLKIRNEEQSNVCKSKTKLINAIPKTYLYANKSYIVVGGLGGFGLELSNWLVLRGCTKLVISSRSGIKTGYQCLMKRRLEKKGVHVLIDTNDITTKSGCQKLIENAAKLGKVGGILNLAAELRDNLMPNQTEQDFHAVCFPKIKTTVNLDVLSREMCPNLDYFICFSSLASGRGNIGQTNYGMANSAMERICENRQLSGFPGKAIQWGAIGDTGLVMEKLGSNDSIISGTLPQRMISCLDTFDTFLQQPHPVLASMVVAEKYKIDTSTVSILTVISHILGIKDAKNIPDTTSLSDINMDSLMGTEIQQTLERNYDKFMSQQDIRNLTFGDLRKMDNKTSTTPSETVNHHSSETLTNGVSEPELVPTESIVCLKKNTNNSQSPIFIIHPIEGYVDSLKYISKFINRSVYGLQCTSDAPSDSAESLSKYYLEKIKNIQNNGPYIIAGYSFGALIAFTIALQLENNGEKIHLIMLDGSPKYVNWHLENVKTLRNKSDDRHVNEALALGYFASASGSFVFSEVYELLLSLSTFDSKLAKTTELLLEHINKPKALISTAANLFCKKLLMALSFNPRTKVKCDVILIKPINNVSCDIAEDYELSDICENKIKILTVKGDHKTFLTENESVTEIAKQINDLNF